MEITFNNSKYIIDTDSCLLDVLKQRGLDQKKGIAVAVNSQVVSKSDWNSKVLHEKDSIIVITATAGG